MSTHTFATMGTVASLRTHAQVSPKVLAPVELCFANADAKFSLYREASEASLIARGELRLADASLQTRDTYARALDWRSLTSGAFTPHRPDGVIDLSGVVKAQAMEEAGNLLDELGVANWLLNVGGDVLARGRERTENSTQENPSPRDWTVGIIDPTDRSSLLMSVPLQEAQRAVATSGIGERGEHIWRRDPHSNQREFIQVTVAAADIVTADALATAILAGGIPALNDATDRFDIDAVTCARDGSLRFSPRLLRRVEHWHTLNP